MSRSDELEAGGIALGGSVVIGIATLIIIAIVGTGIYVMQPAWLGLEREAMKQSHQYTEAKAGMLVQFVDEYNDLETQALQYEDVGKDQIAESLRTQQDGLLDRIHTEADLATEDGLPQSVVTFLAKHPKS